MPCLRPLAVVSLLLVPASALAQMGTGRVSGLTSINVPLGNLYERKGDRVAARAAYEEALKADPTSDAAREALARRKS